MSWPSPFPGVDPFVEAQHDWPDFHHTFLTYWRESLSDVLPDDYEARLDERVNLVDSETDSIQPIQPDIALVHSKPGRTTGHAGAVLLEPQIIPTIIHDFERQGFIKILHRADRSLVTVLELLSPTNKIGGGRDEYLFRRSVILQQDVHLVELDLLTRGERVPMKEPLPSAHYFAIVSRHDRRPDCDVYSWRIPEPLPAIRIPLRAPDPDLLVDLAPIYRTTFERGRYALSIHYAAPLRVSLDSESREWAQSLARQTQKA